MTAMACGKADKPEPIKPAPPAPERADVLYLDPVQHLIRASVDIRGIRPSLEEINYIEKKPGKLREVVEGYLEDPRFGQRVQEIWNEGFLTRTDRPFFEGPPEYQGLATEDDFARAATGETLQLISHVVMNDRPFTEIVTADYTVANNLLTHYYDIKRKGIRPTDWIEAEYNDGRPHAGVLSTTSFHTRWTTTDANRNRGRANAWTRAVLCYDYLLRDVVVDTALDLSDPNVVNNAVRTNPSCLSCHQSLDPLASYFWGYFLPEETDGGNERSYPIKTYSESMEDRWITMTSRRPGYFGYNAGSRLDSLGEVIAEDPRFSMCAVKRFSRGLTGTLMNDLDFTEMDRLHDYFVATDYDAKALVTEIVMSPIYRMGAPLEESAADIVGLKLLGPEQLNRMFNELTGFRWRLDAPLGYNLLENDIYGFRMMSGGYDSIYTTAPANTVNATHILTLRMAAADAAGRVVDAEFAMSPGDRRLLRLVSDGDTDHGPVREQAAALYRMLYGDTIAVDSQEATDITELWQAGYDRSGSTTHAWKLVLTALFSDVRIVFY
jgi:hypothetical protein